MNCPRTGKPMIEVEINGVKVDISTGCGGVWFDNFEFEKFDEPFETVGDELINKMEEYKDASVDCEPRINCPHHPEQKMLRHFSSVKQKVAIDECPKCGGIWLDPGELSAIRGLFSSENERSLAADKYFDQLFNSPEIVAMKTRSENDLKRAKRFANMFKFLCPTYYIKGKQDWGAF